MKKLKKDLITEVFLVFALLVSFIFLFVIDKNVLQWALFFLNIFLLSIHIRGLIIISIFYNYITKVINKFDVNVEDEIKTFYQARKKGFFKKWLKEFIIFWWLQ